MTIADLRNRGLIVLECISGSKAYGLNTPESDTDIKGVFVLPKSEYYGLNYIPQISNETNDVVFYELRRFMELLSVNNPNIIELLNTPEDSVLYVHPYLKEIRPEMFLSKLCSSTFGKFALSQIKKAKGLKKKILTPFPKERKNLLSFCYVNYGQGAISLEKFLEIRGWKQENCGLVKIPHMKDVFGLYYSEANEFKGVIKGMESNEVCLSAVEKGVEQQALFYFNRDGYSTYCKEFREYWDWVDKRNEDRYSINQLHGRGYDSKNMMHVFRLLEMAIEIGRDSEVNVKRPDREFLLDIKAGKFEYEELLKMASQRQAQMELAFESSALPGEPDLNQIDNLTYRLRDKFYQNKTFG